MLKWLFMLALTHERHHLTCCMVARLCRWGGCWCCCRAAVCSMRCCCWAAYIWCRYWAAMLWGLWMACWITYCITSWTHQALNKLMSVHYLQHKASSCLDFIPFALIALTNESFEVLRTFNYLMLWLEYSLNIEHLLALKDTFIGHGFEIFKTLMWTARVQGCKAPMKEKV